MKRNLYIMYAISFFQGMVFYSSVSTLYRQAAGVTVFQMSLIESVFLVLSFALELPWGIIADRIGYRRVMLLCNGLFLVSKLVFWRAESFAGFLVERILLAVTFSGLSGVDSSVVYLSAGPEKSQRAYGLWGAFGTAGALLSAAVFSVFLGDNYRAAAFLTVISHAVAAVLTFGLVEVKPVEKEERTSLRGLAGIMRDILKNRALMTLFVAFTLLGEVCQMVTVVLNQLQYTKSGMRPSAISAVFMVMTLTEFTTVLSEPLTRKLHKRGMGVVFFGVCAASCVALAFTSNPVVSVAGVLLVSLSACVLNPLGSKIENDAITVADRATALSVGAIVSDVLAILLELIFGKLADISLPLAMLFGAALTIAGGALFLVSLRFGERKKN